MNLPYGWHTTLQALRPGSSAGRMRHVEKERSFDLDRYRGIIEIVSKAGKFRGPKEFLECASGGIEIRERGSSLWRQARNLHGHVHLRGKLVIPPDDQVKVIIGFAARRIQEGRHAHVALFFIDPIGCRRSWDWRLMLNHFALRRERAD